MVYENYSRSIRYLATPFDKHTNWRGQAKLLGLSKEASVRLEWFIYYEARAQRNASLTCRHYGIAPKTFYKWKKIFDGKNLRLLESRLSTPLQRRKRAITQLEESRIVALRKQHIRWGKMKLARLYKNIHGEQVSSWRIQYTVKKYKLYYHPARNEKLQKKRKRSQAKKRITELKKQPFPGYLIALDTIVIYWNGTKRYILTAIDTVSKIAFARMYTSKSSKNAADFLKRMVYLLDDTAWNTLNDNGSEFHKEFIHACRDLELTQYWSRVHTPTDNPIDERFNKTLKEEFIALGNMTANPLQFNCNLTEWLIEYNFVRPHQTLGYDTPWEFYQKTAKVLPTCSSRTNICPF